MATITGKDYLVRGTVSYRRGAGASGMLIRAYDKDMRSEQLLGNETKTDHAGRYQISYSAEKYVRAEAGSADLRISVCDPEGREIATSQILFNASAEEVIDVTLPVSFAGPTEYEKLVAAITPDLQGIALNDLTSADIQFLAGDTNEDAKRIAWIASANRAAKSVDGIPAEIFYGLYRQALPTDLPALSKSSQKTLLAAIQSSISQNLIRTFTGKEIQAYLSILQKLAAENELKPGAEKQPATLGDLLALTSLSPEKQKNFAAAWVSRTDTGDDFWQRAQKSAGLTDAETTQVRTTTVLGSVTGGYVPLVNDLQQRMQSDPALKTVAGLASYDLQAWKAVVKAVGPPPGVTGTTLRERITTYATNVANAFEFNYPTAVISSRIQQGLFGFDDKQKTDLATFITNNSTIEFGEATNPLSSYLNGKTVNWTSVEDQAGTTILLSNIDRISKLTSNASQTATLIKDGYASAHAVVSAGKPFLQEKYGNTFGPTQIEQICDRGLKVYNTSLLAFVDNHPILRLPLPYVLTGATLADTASIDVPPDWRSIFGSIDICECTECNSLYGPSAYLVDILNWLKKGTTLSGLTPLDVLLGRRPDIAQVELTCDNADTELSYIDLVNEILEQALVSRSWEMSVGRRSRVITLLNQGQIPDPLRQELLAKFYPLSDSAEVEVIKPGRRWDLRDAGWRFTLTSQGSHTSFPPALDIKITISAWPQTGWKEPELAANAEHLTPLAYDKFLSQTVYPATLPFDLWLEMVRVYLNHLGVPRPQLMESFFNGDFDSAIASPAIVNEYLGLSQIEADICTGALTQDPNKPITLGGPERIFDFWGLIQIASVPDPSGGATPIIGSWDSVLQRVDIFLAQSVLSYIDLLELLETWFVNPVVLDTTTIPPKPKRDAQGRVIRTLTLVSSDPNDQTTCDPHKLLINGLTPAILKNIHRFIRQSRKLGWIFRDLDRALTAIPVDPPLDTPAHGLSTLLCLSHANRLGAKLDIPTQNVFAWWSATLDTNLYLDHTTETQSLVPSVYDSIFRTKTVTTSAVDVFASTQGQTAPPVDYFELNADRTELNYISSGAADPILQHADRVMAALNIGSNDLALLLALTPAEINAMSPLPGGVTVNLGSMTLSSLSFLYRVSSFARALQLSIPDSITVWRLTAQPSVFGSSLDTIRFAYRVSTIRSTSFTIADLDYLLRHEFLPSSPAASNDQTVALFLETLRAGLLQIAKDNTFRNDPSDLLNATSDPNGDLTRSKLALLNWDSDLTTQIVTTLKGTLTYQVKLTNPLAAGFSIPNASETFTVTLTGALPAGFSIPSPLNSAVSYDATTPKLTATRFLTAPERTQLISIATAANLVALTTGVNQLLDLQDGLDGDLNYDAAALTLSFVGPMTAKRRAALANANGATAEFTGFVQALFDAPRKFIARNMRTFSVIDFSLDLPTPLSIVFPASLGARAYTESAGGTMELHYVGVMSAQDQSILNLLSGDVGYLAAVNTLFQKPVTIVPALGDAFLNGFAAGAPPPFGPDISALFDGNTQPADRFGIVLQKLLPYLKQKLSTDLVVQSTATAFQLDSRSAESLLSTWLTAQLDPLNPTAPVPCLRVWLDPAFSESNPNSTTSWDNFPAQFLTYTRVQKAAMVVSRLKQTFVQLGWLFDHGATAGWLDLNSLPLQAGAATASFDAWRHTVALAALRDALPDGETLLSEIFAIAYATAAPADPTSPIRELLVDNLEWNADDLTFLTGTQGLSFSTLSSYQNERALHRLVNCFAKIKRLGASAKQCMQWCVTKLKVTDAISAKSAARSKYNEADWLQRAKPLNDALRDKQRNALVAYLIANPQKDAAGRPIWSDDDGLYGYYLIDVDMGTCMKTSRLVQATASAQLFVQRCLLNLESRVSIDPDQAIEWNEWRKYYRVWEANREVFLYPENWIQPELRDDKTPFFKDLESELLQDNITSDSAEAAFAHYLDKLHQIGRLEIIAIYHEMEAATPQNGLDGAIDQLHVVGRTMASPNFYYYRKLENSLWSPWEKMDVDINGDHLILGVTNRRLYAFWPIFKEQTAPSNSSQPLSSSDLTPQPSLWEVQLAASSYRDGRWSAKKLSSDTPPLSCPKIDGVALKEAFTFRRIGTPDNFTINCFAAENIITGPAPITYQQPVDGMTPWPDPKTPSNVEVHVVDAANGYQPIPSAYVTFNSVDHSQGVDAQGNWYDYPIHTFSAYTDVNGLIIFNAVSPDDYVFAVTPPSSDYDPNSLAAISPADLTQQVALGNIYSRYLLLSGTPQSQPAQATVQELVLIGFFSLTCGEQLVTTPFDGNQLFSGAYDTYIDGMMLDSNRNSLSPPLYLSLDQSLPIFTKTPAPFSLLLPNTESAEFANDQFFQDDVCTYYIRQAANAVKIQFVDFYHPYVCNFLSVLYARGLDGLLTLETQQLSDAISLTQTVAIGRTFYLRYGLYVAPGSLLDVQHLPREIVDFSPQGAYSIYNWEVFFHIPFEIAVRLSTNQRFEEAQEWFNYIFDPTASGTPTTGVSNRAASFWKFKPFRDLLADPPQTLQDLLNDAAELDIEVDAWTADPFNPHLIARHRPLAYMKSVVMKYIGNLLDWGDMLFTSDTRETDAEATQIYILAAQILGKRPERRPARATSEVSTYDSITASGVSFDPFSNAMVAIESFVFPSGPSTGTSNPPVQLPYFCLSGNDVLLGYWDRVADRLFKLRNCMNIEGIVRDLPLFQPPIDPAILVRAVAAGADLSSVLSDLNAPLPYYRFNVLLQKAMEMCNEVKSLGGALLSALEKRDAESLAALRSQHDIQALTAMKAVKEQQLAEATNNLTAAQQSLAVVQVRKTYYQGLVQAGATSPGPTPPSQGQLGKNSLKLNANESQQLDLMGQALSTQQDQTTVELLGGILSLVPDIKIGAITTDGASFGGSQLGNALRTVSSYMGSMVSMMNSIASMSGIVGGHERRSEEWQFQLNLATAEVTQFTTQVAAATVRQAIAQADLDAQNLQIDNANDVDTFLREKYTNQDLYVWMIGQLAGTYFQSYQLAYSLAKRAEQCYRHELGLEDSNFIQFGYWDSLKKGLLAGERLAYDLKRMDSAYMDQNRREYEILKHVSILSLDPYALLQLKETGECTVNIPESAFDLDFAGHYLRRIKSVGLTIPCVTGPYTSVPCTLTLLKSTLRRVSQVNSGSAAYARSSTDDTRFIDIPAGTESIVTSSGQNDAGLFEANLRDERFLPFEGMGAVSEWRLHLPADLRQFDYNTISDVILHMRYTARDGGESLRAAAAAELQKAINAAVSDSQNTGAFRLFSARQEFPDAWYQFSQALATTDAAGAPKAITFPLAKERFPFVFRTRNITLTSIDVILNFSDAYLAKNDPSKLQWTFASGTNAVAPVTTNPIPTPNPNLQSSQLAGTLWIGSKDANAGPDNNWTLGLWLGAGVTVPKDFIEDIFLLSKYAIA
ncbi:neuraminidase-like domain-containing protein [Tunturiibacter lichenicola]|uniref:Tc toxin subunit A-related protein n=1 Tax=Tunturiibacter lichenicola TaxID=2051959 RepID=UPI003D9ACD75